MLDLKFIRENPDTVRKAIEVKRVGLNLDDLLKADNDATELKRREGLVSKGVVAATELDALKTRKRVFEATLDRRKAEIAQKFIYAPWDGRVGLKDIALGSYLAPGQKIVWLQKIDPVYVDFTVTEADYGRITEGGKVTVTLNAYPNESFTGKGPMSR